MEKFDQVKYSNDYARDHYRQYNFRVSLELDKDIIEGIETMRNTGMSANAFIRECIRAGLRDDKFLEDTMAKAETAKNVRL